MEKSLKSGKSQIGREIDRLIGGISKRLSKSDLQPIKINQRKIMITKRELESLDEIGIRMKKRGLI